MCGVYQGAFLTIAALGATTSEEGLYAVRDPLAYSRCDLFEASDGKVGSDYPWSGNRELVSRKSGFPLHLRSWVTQEKILAPRTLNFGPYMSWECQESIRNEYKLPSELLNHTQGLGQSREFYQAILTPSTSDATSKARDRRILGIWNGIVKLYTRGNLTKASDRLVAISGIIAAIQRRTGWLNISGLWEPFLWTQLLWGRGGSFSSQDSKSSGLTPSWSWISVSGESSFQYDFLSEHWTVIANVKRIANVTASKPGPTGTYESRMALEISCMPAKPTDPTSDEEPEFGRGFVNSLIPGFAQMRHWQDIMLDTEADFYLPIAAMSRHGILTVYGIAIVACGSCEGTFRRLGHICYDSYNQRREGIVLDHALCITTLQDQSLWKTFILV